MSEMHTKLIEMQKTFRKKLQGEYLKFKSNPISDQDDFEIRLQELEYFCHKIAGSAGTFGLHETSLEMRNLELEIMEERKTSKVGKTELENFHLKVIKILKKV